MLRPRSGRENVTIALDPVVGHHDHRIGTEFRHWLVFVGALERAKSEVHALRRTDAQRGPARATGFIPECTLQLELCFDPATPRSEMIHLVDIPTVGHQHSIPHNEML